MSKLYTTLDSFWQKNNDKLIYVNFTGKTPLTKRGKPLRRLRVSEFMGNSAITLVFKNRKTKGKIVFVINFERFLIYYKAGKREKTRMYEMDYHNYANFGISGGFRTLWFSGHEIKRRDFALEKVLVNPKARTLAKHKVLVMIIAGTIRKQRETTI